MRIRCSSNTGASDDEGFRRDVVYAFAGAEDAGAIGKLLALALTPAMRLGEVRYLYEFFADEPVARACPGPWLKAHFGDLSRRTTLARMARAVGLLANACTPELRADMDRFFQPYVARIGGGESQLVQSDLMIDRCVAFRQAKGGELSAALAAATR